LVVIQHLIVSWQSSIVFTTLKAMFTINTFFIRGFAGTAEENNKK
jgi:hypothetical protein